MYEDNELLKDIENKFGIHFEEIGDGHAVAYMDITDSMRNLFGLVYGGLIVHLADLTAGVCFISAGGMGPTVNLETRFMSGTAKAKRLYCEATDVKRGKNLHFVETVVRDENGRETTRGSFTFYQYSKEDEKS